MNKNHLILIFLLFSCYSYTQALDVAFLKKIYQLPSIKEKCDYLYSKGFAKEPNSNSSIIKVSKKKFIKKIQAFDQEIITIINDTVTYSVTDSKKYLEFKNFLPNGFKSQTIDQSRSDAGTILLHRKDEVLLIYETDEEQQESNSPVRFFHFKFYRKLN